MNKIFNKFYNIICGKDGKSDNKAGFRPLPTEALTEEEKDLADIAKNGDPIPDCYTKSSKIRLRDIVDLDEAEEFLDRAEVDCDDILSARYKFIKSGEDIDRYVNAFKLILRREDVSAKEPERNVTEPTENMQHMLDLATSLIDNIRSLTIENAHLKYDILIGAKEVNKIHPDGDKFDKTTRKEILNKYSVAARNKALIADKEASKKFMDDFKILKPKDLQKKYNISETTMYNLRKRIVAKYGEKF